MRKRCPVCRNKLESDGTCRFASSHENILKMRAEQGRKHSESEKGKLRGTQEERTDIARKGSWARWGTYKRTPKDKNAAKAVGGRASAAKASRDAKGRFTKKKNGKKRR